MIEVVLEDNKIGGNYYEYYFIGELTGTRYFREEDYEDQLTDKEIMEYETEIEEAIARYDEGDPNLATYFNDPDIKMDEVNIGIKYINGKMCSYTKVTTLEPLDTEDKINKVRDWLTGQYSDGWGEGFEQRPIEEYEDEYEYEEYYEDDPEDEDEERDYGYRTETGYQIVEVFIHFWNPNMAPLKFVKGGVV